MVSANYEQLMRSFENGGRAKPTGAEGYSIKLGVMRKPLWIPLENNNVFYGFKGSGSYPLLRIL